MTKSCAVIIFNFIDFEKHKLESRTASFYDVERLENLFYLFDTCIKKVINPSLAEFNKAIDELSNLDFTDYESILLIYMSHGDTENKIYCNDGDFNFLEESKKIFRNESLKDKPKFIVVQACKGSLDDSAAFYDYDDKEQNVSDDSQITAILMSSYEGFISTLGANGSMFIEVFTDTVRKSWKKKPFIEILEEAHDKFNQNQHESAGTIHKRFGISQKIKNFTLH